ncbi:MAG TPA: Ku protein [Rubrivivax sp.]|jgi:DNA end-binding protein Ku|nr:Ku protein [Rubrivivax sp.]
MATRIIWKGAISFGLVHVPVALLPASTTTGIDFDWLDKRSLDPVGYKRVNKRTGKEIDKEHIVKGVKVEGGSYVVISEDEIKAAYPKTTQTIEIEAFVKAPEVPFTYLEAPYYLEPLARGEKVYALLREAMLDAGVIGIARVVMHSKEHLAALVPTGPALMLNTLRWAEEVRPAEGLKLPPEGKAAAGLKEAELKMARQLVDDMTGKFEPDRYTDKFADAVHALIKQRVAAGETSTVQPLEEAAGATASNVVDLTELLARSLGKRKPAAANDAPARPAKKATAPRKAAAAKKRAA